MEPRKVKASKLLAALSAAKPSLGSSDALPILSHFVFDKEIVYAYNDVTAIIIEHESDLSCALHGDTLIGLLELAAPDEDVQIRTGKTGVIEMRTKAGWVKIPALPITDSPFAMPASSVENNIPINEELVKGLERCLISVSSNSLKPEFGGVTFFAHATDKHVALYSTDNTSASRYIFPLDGKHGTIATVLPEIACRQIIKLFGAFGDGTLGIGPAAAEASFKSATLISKLLESKPKTFIDVFKEHADEAVQSGRPDGFEREIKQAVLLTSREIQKTCLLTVEKKMLTITAEGSLGNMSSIIGCDQKENVFLHIDPAMILRALPHGVNIAIRKRCMVMSSGNFTHLISASALSPSAAQ
jgi:DNA polymerase III sliding clamp (beta) subunit (PCNA family)